MTSRPQPITLVFDSPDTADDGGPEFFLYPTTWDHDYYEEIHVDNSGWVADLDCQPISGPFETKQDAEAAKLGLETFLRTHMDRNRAVATVRGNAQLEEDVIDTIRDLVNEQLAGSGLDPEIEPGDTWSALYWLGHAASRQYTAAG